LDIQSIIHREGWKFDRFSQVKLTISVSFLFVPTLPEEGGHDHTIATIHSH